MTWLTTWKNRYNTINRYDVYGLEVLASNIDIKEITVGNGYSNRNLTVEIHSRGGAGQIGYAKWVVMIRRGTGAVATVTITSLHSVETPSYGLTATVVGGATEANTITISTTGASASEKGYIMVTLIKIQ